MSKHRHKSRDINRMRNPSFNNYMNNNPFGISPQQLLGLLGSNIDMTGVGNILSSMGQEGFNMNSANTQMPDNNMNNSSNVNNVLNNEDVYHDDKTEDILHEIKPGDMDDENIKFLQSIKSIVSVERARFVDKIIELYNAGAFKDLNK